jgi:hypothetical protein
VTPAPAHGPARNRLPGGRVQKDRETTLVAVGSRAIPLNSDEPNLFGRQARVDGNRILPG